MTRLTRLPLAWHCASSSRANKPARGAAMLLALLVVALVATLAATLTWQQWRAVQVESAHRARLQAAWILTGAGDWARLILREDARSDSASAPRTPPHDHLGEPWATPLEEARLSTFLAAQSDWAPAQGPEAFISGQVTDAQARYNLRNLLSDDRQVVKEEEAVLRRLCEAAQVGPEVAAQIVQGLARSWAAPTPGGVEGPAQPLRVQQLEHLAWLGLEAATVERLRPWVVVLPQRAVLNVNTASAATLAAVMGVDMAVAERLARERQSRPFAALDALRGLLPPEVAVDGNRLGVQSGFFEVRGRLRLEDRVMQEQLLVQRRGLEVTVLRRERRHLVLPGA